MRYTGRMLRVLLLLGALPLLAPAQRIFPPLRIIGNVYYVGDNDLASYLITTPKGSILINTGYEYSVPEIRSRIGTLGFKYSDIKILLVTHAHSDHAAGEAAVKRQTHAQMLAMAEEAPLLETGGKTDYLFGNSGWFPPVKVDRTLHDGEKIELGGTVLTAYLHPGAHPRQHQLRAGRRRERTRPTTCSSRTSATSIPARCCCTIRSIRTSSRTTRARSPRRSNSLATFI